MPPLTLKFGKAKAPPISEAPPPAEAPPSATSTVIPKLKIKVGSKSGATPQPPTTQDSTPSTATKPARKSKPTPKKRAAEEAANVNAAIPDSDSDNAPAPAHPIKKLKLTSRKPSLSAGAPFLKIRAKGKPPLRPLGVGYDSEASDREEDPTITDNLILRMQPGEDCEYLRQAVNERRWGPVRDGGADVRMRFLTKDGRRGVIIIRGKMYAFVLVDLPCIIEAMKSWEKKTWWKSGDIWQMLLVLGQCKSDDEALSYPLPSRKGEVDAKTFQYAHGLTPPLRWCRKRRFRKRISVRAVEEDEREVERLLQADAECEPGTSRYRLYDSVEDYDRQNSQVQDFSEEADEEVDEGGNMAAPVTGIADADAEGEDADEDIFAAEMEKALLAHADEEDAAAAAAAASPPASATEPAAPTQQSPPSSSAQSPAVTQLQTADTPTADTPTAGATTTSEDDESEEDESDEDEVVEEIDPDALEAQQEEQRQREEIQDLEDAIAREKEALTKMTNAILRKKMFGKIEGLESDLQVRQAALGIEGEGEG